MVSGGPLLLAAVTCLFLIASALWAERRFAGYDRLPRQFGFTLKPTSYGPRWVIIWLVSLVELCPTLDWEEGPLLWRRRELEHLLDHVRGELVSRVHAQDCSEMEQSAKL